MKGENYAEDQVVFQVRDLRGVSGPAAVGSDAESTKGAPAKPGVSGFVGERRSKGADEGFTDRRKRSQADFATTSDRCGRKRYGAEYEQVKEDGEKP